MKYFTNLSTRSKLLLGFGVILFLFIVVIILAYRSTQEITQSEKKMNDVHFTIAFELQQLRNHQNFIRAAILEMTLTQNTSVQLAIEKTLVERASAVNENIEKISSLDVDPQFQNRIIELKNKIAVYRDTREEAIAFIKAGKVREAQTLAINTQRDQFEKIRLLAVTMVEKATKDIDDQLALDQQKADSSLLLFTLCGIVALMITVFLIVVMNKTIAQPLTVMTTLASRIASGDLKVEFRVDDRKDEVGLLNQAFYLMVEKLRVSIKEIMEGVALLGSSAAEILAATTQVASGSSETASAISETTTTVEEVRQAAQLSNQKASRVSENAQQVAQVTQTGQKAVDETVKGIQDVQNQMETVANTIVRLSEQSQQISGIIASVTDVADQSNLLAVNAAIEAAKAGEQGKGFAIVAQEIKNLAQQSKQATIQVRNILTDVQKATSAAVMSTEQTSKAVENGVKQSILAGEAIKNLAESSSKAVDAASLIVASSQQQVVGMDQIGLAMQNINQAGTQNAASMVQAEKAAKGLHELGQKLQRLVEQYKL